MGAKASGITIACLDVSIKERTGMIVGKGSYGSNSLLTSCSLDKTTCLGPPGPGWIRMDVTLSWAAS